MSKPAPAATHHSYGRVVVGLLCFGLVFFLAGVAGLVFLANGTHITGIPGCMFVIAGTLTILGFVFALAGRNLDCIRAMGGIDDETGEIRRPIIQARRMDGEWVGMTGRRYGMVPMQKPRADTTVYGGESATLEQPAVMGGGRLVATINHNGHGRLSPDGHTGEWPIEKDDAYYQASADILETLLQQRDDDPPDAPI